MQIQDQDFIAKELLKHRKCYLDYTWAVGKPFKDKERKDAEGSRKNVSAVCECVQRNILEFQQSISMETLITGYGGSKTRKQLEFAKREII